MFTSFKYDKISWNTKHEKNRPKTSNKYTRLVLSQYSNNNKINVTKDKKIDLLVYTVIYALLNNMKFHRHYKERITSFLTAFELNKSSIT